MKLYYHQTDGGAEYLCSNNVEGTDEGSFDSNYIVRIDGDITKDGELNIKGTNNDKLIDALNYIDELAEMGGYYGEEKEEQAKCYDLLFNYLK